MAKLEMNEIWRSKPEHWNKTGWKIDLCLGLLVSLVFFIPSLLSEDFISFAILIILGIAILIFTGFAVLRYVFPYIIITNEGVILREQYIFKNLKSRFIPFQDIDNVDYNKYQKKKLVKFIPITENILDFRLFLKDGGIYILNKKWISNYRKGIKLILEHVKLKKSINT
jgi:hypothetical protein